MVAPSSVVPVSAVYVEMIPTAPFPLSVFSYFFCLCRVSHKEKYQMNYLYLFFYPSSLSACSVSDHINLTVSLLNFLLSS